MMAGNLTDQVRFIFEVTKAVTRRFGQDCRGRRPRPDIGFDDSGKFHGSLHCMQSELAALMGFVVCQHNGWEIEDASVWFRTGISHFSLRWRLAAR